MKQGAEVLVTGFEGADVVGLRGLGGFGGRRGDGGASPQAEGEAGGGQAAEDVGWW